MTRAEMDLQLQRLVVLKAMPGDTDGYWDALQDIPLDVLTAAMSHALRSRAWFPTPAEIRTDCDSVRVQPAMVPSTRRRPATVLKTVELRNPLGGPPLVLTITKDWDDDCTACLDTGWAVYWCGAEPSARLPWMTQRRCGREDEHYSHEWAEVCYCIATNETIQRRKAAGFRYAQPAQKVAV